jgi:hypothetical protein
LNNAPFCWYYSIKDIANNKELIMRIGKLIALIVLTSIICACSKDKATDPPQPAHAVSLEYRNSLGGIYCLRLTVGVNTVNQCGLGTRSISIWDGDYECKLYSVIEGEHGENLTLLATSPLHLDRNFTCVVDGVHVYWMYWD